MTNNDVRRDIPVSPLTSEGYFALADMWADRGYDEVADQYWQLGARQAAREASDD